VFWIQHAWRGMSSGEKPGITGSGTSGGGGTAITAGSESAAMVSDREASSASLLAEAVRFLTTAAHRPINPTPHY